MNCASLGCPNLWPRAFTGGDTPGVLDAAAREFVNHPRGAAFVQGKLQLSSLLAGSATWRMVGGYTAM